MTTAKTNYIPGICNINPAEIRQRRMTGHIGLLITAVTILILILMDAPWFARLVVFIPAFLAATGYLQAHNKFCVGFASAGEQHADDGEVVTIDDKKALAADAQKTRKMNLQSGAIALGTALLTLFIPA